MNNKDKALNSRFAVWTELEDDDAVPVRNKSSTVNKYQEKNRRFNSFETCEGRQSSSISRAPQNQTLQSQGNRNKEPFCKESATIRDLGGNRRESKANHRKLKSNQRQPSTYKYTSNFRKVDDIPKSNSADIRTQERVIRSMSWNYLTALVEKTPNEIILTILSKSSGFDALLLRSDLRRDMMANVLIALGEACLSDLSTNISKLIIKVTSNKEFFLINVQQYLATFQKYSPEDMHLKSLLSLTVFLQKFQHSQPSSATDSLLILLPFLKMTCEKALKSSKYYDLVMVKLSEIERENKSVLERYSAEELQQMSRREKLQLQEPPENYRMISVLPTDEDIHQPCTFLRPNLVKGKYQDVDHYLDVQYRLLKEDYVKPLRDGIAEYLRLKKNGKPLKSCKDVRVYLNVYIIKQKFAHGGLVHVATFNIKDFPHIKWEYSKRFLTGSLLCLSSDDFKTMLFASVVYRNPAELRQGLLLLRFEEITDEVLNLSPLRSFAVIETDAYFEAYRHNLYALRELDEAKLPLKQYIVDVEKTALKPQYLSETTTYDMRPLLLPLDKKYIKRSLNSDKRIVARYDFPLNISQGASSVPVLDDRAWPSCSELGLDSSQYAAMKAAITKEFAVIQGPPGTGKTFIGLRIVQLLLHNSEKWKKAREDGSPILIVCYTNHALDQFLEGLLLFTQNIVRIGGRGKNEALSNFQLSSLKTSLRTRGEIPNYIGRSVWQKFEDLKDLQRDIEFMQHSIEKTFTSILSENELLPFIAENHYSSLIKKRKTIIPETGLHVHLVPIIHEWLGINGKGNTYATELVFDNSEIPLDDKTNALDPQEANACANNNIVQEEYEVDSEDGVDIEYIEAQRDVSTEDFADVFDSGLLTVETCAGWQSRGGKSKFSQYVQNCLNNIETMNDSDEKKVMDVWKLDIQHRWQLYKLWLQKYVEAKQMESLEKQQLLQQEYKALNEIRMEEDMYVLRSAEIVGMTTTGAAKYRSIVQRLNPQIVIIEEAAEILECHVVTSLGPNTEHIILIGDHQQLKPNPTVHMLAVKYDLNVSLFERMVNNGMDCHRLVKQHRMRPDIASLLVPHIYSSLENHESVFEYENIKGINKNIFFVSHNYCELHAFDSKSKVNEHEAKFLVKLCKYLVLQGYDSSQITILTTYSGQFFELKKLAAVTLIKGVRITIVDNFQGEENDIILISFVRSNEEGEIGFLKISNRICVALSRAKKGLYCIGNFELLAGKSQLWHDIVSTLHQKQAVGPSLQLVCQNHPEVCSVVATEKDFDTVPEGGCTRPCEFRLSCGHTCPLICHPYDRAHEFAKCSKPCNKVCSDCNRQCIKKCYMECQPCISLIDKYLSSCGHTIHVECFQRNLETPCTKSCTRLLPCGHECTNKCSESCVIKCVKKVSVNSSVCGHEVSMKCFNSSNTEEQVKVCGRPCGIELSCGHTCKGTCSKCHQGRLHVACREKCKRILVCGHECTSPCSKSCPPCRQRCENRCIHSKCPKKCGEPCEKCSERCEWFCPHEKCIALCGEPCSRLPCNEPCPELLKCGHPCIGFCGEPCPKECRECDREKVKEIFFGSEDEENARYLCLEDCGHLFENEGFMHWMNTGLNGEREIQMKTCPKCKTVIRRNLRYGNIIKSCLADIEKVKSKTYGNKEKNHEMQVALFKRIVETGDKFVDSVCKLLRKVLSSKKGRSIQEITTMENVINLVFELLEEPKFITNTMRVEYLSDSASEVETCSDSDSDVEYYSAGDSEIRNITRELIDYCTLSKKQLITFIENEYLTASEQQLQDLSWEVHRLKLANKLLKFVKGRAVKYPNINFERMTKCLVKYAPFRKEDVQLFSCNFETFARQFGSAVINVTEMEKQSILKAMGLSRGHWYQCPNGHVYCITECGGAMQESKCNECNAAIGGTDHRLLSTNRVASDMDGSKHPSWSEVMNMENFRF